MIFTAPLVLLGLLALPAIFFLLRLNPPVARRIRFPPFALLRDLAAAAPAPRRMPLWLLILRLAAAALVILGLAGPALHPPPALPGAGPILLVIDDGWASAADWPLRRAAARRILAAAGAAHRPVALLTTAVDGSGPPRVTGLMAAGTADQIIEALQPKPWPADRRADAEALATAAPPTRLYIADGIADSAGFDAFINILAPDHSLVAARPPALLLSAQPSDGGLAIRAANAPGAGILARTAANAVLAATTLSGAGRATIALPPSLANQVASLALAAPASAAGTLLLDGSTRATTAGIAAGGGAAETPFLGPLYFIRRALPAGTHLVTGALAGLFTAAPGLLILADTPLNTAQSAAARTYLAQGGVLVRFAGPLTAISPDALSPDPLLSGDRRLGGALTWSASQQLGGFSAASPFAGLTDDPGITVSRQILADPTRLDPTTVWASLKDGTPLVLGATVGKGVLVSILTSANADWSSLALSGLYPAMLARLAALSNGAPPKPNLALPLRLQLSAYGVLAPPLVAASLTPARLASTVISPAAPAGLYGDGAGGLLALNLGGHVPAPLPVTLPNAIPLGGAPPQTDLGATLIATALLLLAADLAISLRRRGLLALPGLVLSLLWLAPGQAQSVNPALQTSLGYLLTGDAATDQLSADGLAYLSADVSAHTSAALGAPAALDAETDDLAPYPLIYWPIDAAAPAPGQAACAALNSYMTHGGLLLIDTDGGDAGGPGSGAGLAEGAAAALTRATACLALPPLQPLTDSDVLAHCFYILHDFPGRFTGAPVLVAAPDARDDDGATPVIIGQNGWAGAWARDATGLPEQLPLPGGDAQRRTADRFGTNLVIYALTGSYKADQTNIAALLQRLGQ